MATMATCNSKATFVRAKPAARGRAVVVATGGKRIDPKTVPVQSVEDDVVRNNLLGVSRFMKDKNWRDSSGRKGKGVGVYRFESKYGVNCDGLQPIYAPDTWSNGGSEYRLGTAGLIAWAGLLLVGLAVSISLIVSTSQLGQ